MTYEEINELLARFDALSANGDACLMNLNDLLAIQQKLNGWYQELPDEAIDDQMWHVSNSVALVLQTDVRSLAEAERIRIEELAKQHRREEGAYPPDSVK